MGTVLLYIICRRRLQTPGANFPENGFEQLRLDPGIRILLLPITMTFSGAPDLNLDSRQQDVRLLVDNP